MSTDRARVSSNGQVSVPARVRRRWGTRDVIVVDNGDHIVVRPVPDDPVADIIGKYAFLPSSDALREQARAEDAARDADRP